MKCFRVPSPPPDLRPSLTTVASILILFVQHAYAAPPSSFKLQCSCAFPCGRDAFAEVLESRRREHLFVEIVLIQGINDTPELARALASLLGPLPTRASINLLPYNDTGHPVFRASSSEAVQEFQRVLNEQGFIATIRTAR